MDIKKLIAIGLKDKEARLYLAALQLGTASITSLAKKAKIKRPTAYLIIEDLLNKQLLTVLPKGKNIHFGAAHPTAILKELEKKRLATIALLPELKAMYDSVPVQINVTIKNNKINNSKTFSVGSIFKAFGKK